MQGSGVDASLNDTGRAQARAFYDVYKDIPFDRVYTSELKRSKESVMQFASRGIRMESMNALNEISWGAKEGQRITPDEDAYYHWMLKQWQAGQTHIPIEGGESPDAVAVRQQLFVNALRSRPDERNVLVCMHGRAMRILLCQLMHYPLRSMDMFEHENLCLYLLHHNGNQFTVELYNNTDHLKHLRSVVHGGTVVKG